MMVFIITFCRVIVFDYVDNCLVLIVITLLKVIVIDYIGQVIVTILPSKPLFTEYICVTLVAISIGFHSFILKPYISSQLLSFALYLFNACYYVMTAVNKIAVCDNKCGVLLSNIFLNTLQPYL